MKTIILLFFSLCPALIFSQDVLVNDADLPEAEFHVAINPTDTNNIVLAVQRGFGSGNNFGITIYYTHDFGATWTESNYHGNNSGAGASGDPVLSFDDAGNVLMVNLYSSTGISTILSKSTDGGATWAQVSTVSAGFTDKPWMAIDNSSTSPYQNNIYIPLVESSINLYTINNSYQNTDTLAIPDGQQLPSVVVKKDGTVFTSTIDLTGANNTVYVQEYSNGGSNLVHSTVVASFPDYTFNAPDVSLRFQPTAYLAIDNSGGTYDGRLYLTYTASEAVNPDYFNVFIIYSDDNGLNWSAPQIVHSNTDDEVQQFYSSSYINNDGVLLVDWYDRKNYSNTTKLTDFFLGISHDGGDSFTEIRLNTDPSDFDDVIPSSNNFGIGEYHQLVATDYTALSFWSDGRTNDGDLNIYMSKININGPFLNVQEHSLISENFKIGELYPNPGKNTVYSDIQLHQTSKLRYQIFNQAGQKLIESEWKTYKEGAHQLEINHSLPSGLYLVKIQTNEGYHKSLKLINH